MKLETTRERRFSALDMVLIAGLGVLFLGLLWPRIRSSPEARRAQAGADVRSIRNAIQAYFTEYGKLPVPDSDQGRPDRLYQTHNSAIIDALMAKTEGANTNNGLNPRRIVFLEPPARKNGMSANGDFIDPWGHAYLIKTDNNDDELIEWAGKTNKARVLVISAGPNGVTNSFGVAGCDDIFSFE